jgi:hypothetical protein
MDYIPSKLKDYYDWQDNLVSTVTTNAATWGIDPTVLADLQTRSSDYKPLYLAIKNKPTRTAQQVSAHDVYKKTYTKYLRSFVQSDLVNNALIPVDALVGMGLNPHLYIRTERPKITDKPSVVPENVGGGEVRFRCTQPGSDSKGRHPDSNGIELFYVIESVAAKVNPVEPVPGDAEEQKEEDALFLPSVFSPRANFIHSFGVNHVGKVLRVYGRWVNTSDRAKSGPFGGIVSLVIS